MTIRPEDFSGWSLGARFYPLLYLLTRVGEALDWGTGLPLKSDLLGKGSRLEVHHIFPKSRLYKHAAGYDKAQVNAIANFCFLTQDSNLAISNKKPEVYFDEIETRFPGSLESQWIPPDRSLWKMESYLDFLAARRELLSRAANGLLAGLLHGFEVEEPVVAAEVPPAVTAEVRTTETAAPVLPGGVESEEEEELIVAFNEWVMNQGLPEGELFYEAVHPETGEPLAILDLAWPRGLQEGLSEPVALLVDEGPTTLTAASAAGFKFFTRIEAFRHYVEHEVLALDKE